jgi:hypothetical protein
LGTRATEAHLTPPDALSAPPNLIPDPDHIRAAIDAADERARLLRRLPRLALRLRLSLTTADRLPQPTPTGPKGGDRG